MGANKPLLNNAVGMAHQLSPQNNMLLEQLLQQLSGSRCRITTHHVIQQQEDYAVVYAQLEQPTLEIVVKLAGPYAPIDCPFERTAAIVQRVRRATTVPTFEVLAADEGYSTWPWRYLVTTFVGGQTWAAVRAHLNAGQQHDTYQEMGDAIAQLHALNYEAFGPIDSDGTVRTSGDYVDQLIERAIRRIRNPQHAQIFAGLVQERAHLFADVPQPALCHEDLNPRNLLFEHAQGRWHLSAVLDFDSAWAGNGESDLARSELWEGMIGAGWWEAYTARHTVAAGYHTRRAMYQLLWCLEYAAATPQHLADTRRVCAELGIAPITFS